MNFHHLGPYAEDLTHYAGVPAIMPMPAALVAGLPSMTPNAEQDELG